EGEPSSRLARKAESSRVNLRSNRAVSLLTVNQAGCEASVDCEATAYIAARLSTSRVRSVVRGLSIARTVLRVVGMPHLESGVVDGGPTIGVFCYGLQCGNKVGDLGDNTGHRGRHQCLSVS